MGEGTCMSMSGCSSVSVSGEVKDSGWSHRAPGGSSVSVRSGQGTQVRVKGSQGWEVCLSLGLGLRLCLGSVLGLVYGLDLGSGLGLGLHFYWFHHYIGYWCHVTQPVAQAGEACEPRQGHSMGNVNPGGHTSDTPTC